MSESNAKFSDFTLFEELKTPDGPGWSQSRGSSLISLLISESNAQLSEVTLCNDLDVPEVPGSTEILAHFGGSLYKVN